MRGTPEVHTTVTPTKSSGTFVAYLYDVGPLGVGKLVTHAPYTFHDREPGLPFAVDLSCTPRPTTYRPVTGSLSSWTPSTRCTSSTTRPARS